MADWRQIQARIRKAKTSSDPPAQLAELYERTRDAMVAFELATWQEKAGNHAEAARWYTSAAQRFRRAQWRTKAEEALTRLGAPIPVAATAAELAAEAAPSESLGADETTFTVKTTSVVVSGQSPELAFEISGESVEEESTPATAAAPLTEGAVEAHNRNGSGGADDAAAVGGSAARGFSRQPAARRT